MVFQWNSDGTEFAELNFGVNGTNDNYGTVGGSRTGGHHIIGIAEMMARGLTPDVVITMASAHSNPTSGNEYEGGELSSSGCYPGRPGPGREGVSLGRRPRSIAVASCPPTW